MGYGGKPETKITRLAGGRERLIEEEITPVERQEFKPPRPRSSDFHGEQFSAYEMDV